MAKQRKLPPLAICYDFDGTLAPGNMQERDFIPAIGTTTKDFWDEVRSESERHNADNILIYMWMMLKKAESSETPVRRDDFKNFGKSVPLFTGVECWFDEINTYAKERGVEVSHHIISAGIREMIEGTSVAKYFTNIFASSYCYDHHGIAKWPALAMNYTAKTQFLFRINKGVNNVYDHTKINNYVAPEERPIPFSNMVYIGDGETDVPCFRLVKSQGGHSIVVYKPNTSKAKTRSMKLVEQGRVSFISPADYSIGKGLDNIIKAIIDKIAADTHLKGLR
jgi:hypothetical protein